MNETKDFIEQVNDIAAPVTRVYSDPRIVELEIKGSDLGDEEAVFTMRVRFKRKSIAAVEGPKLWIAEKL